MVPPKSYTLIRTRCDWNPNWNVWRPCTHVAPSLIWNVLVKRPWGRNSLIGLLHAAPSMKLVGYAVVDAKIAGARLKPPRSSLVIDGIGFHRHPTERSLAASS